MTHEGNFIQEEKSSAPSVYIYGNILQKTSNFSAL
jgi:hypothetical protein